MRSEIRTTPPPPCPAPFNMAQYVLAAGLAHPERIALHVIGPTRSERWSHGRLCAAVRGVGSGLLARGLQPGDRILMRLGNTVDFPILYLGAIAAGLVPVPTPAQLTAPEITRLAGDLDPALVVAGPDISLPDHPAPRLDLPALRAMHALPPCDWALGDPDRLAYMICTSGSSGQPRAVMHAHRAVWARRMMWAGWYGLRPDDRVLHAGAFNWTYTLGTGLLDPWAIGATALVPAQRADPGVLGLLLKRHEATIFASSPGVYRQILKHHTKLDLPALRHGLSAGEKLPTATRDAWRTATGTEIHEALGMSECSTFVSASPDRPARDGTVGYAQPGRHIAVLGADGTPVPRGTPGVLAIHRSDPGLFLGYRGASEDTAARFSGAWYLTGDTVVMHDDSAISYLGREDDMMNAGGFRVAPLEVERALEEHPDILEAACAEVRIRADTTVIAAFYTGPRALPDSVLADWAAERLARYKQPRLYIHRDTLPRGVNNKLLRRALRHTFEAAHDPA